MNSYILCNSTLDPLQTVATTPPTLRKLFPECMQHAPPALRKQSQRASCQLTLASSVNGKWMNVEQSKMMLPPLPLTSPRYHLKETLLGTTRGVLYFEQLPLTTQYSIPPYWLVCKVYICLVKARSFEITLFFHAFFEAFNKSCFCIWTQ